MEKPVLKRRKWPNLGANHRTSFFPLKNISADRSSGIGT